MQRGQNLHKYLNIWRESLTILRDFINAPNIKNAFVLGITLYAIALFALIRGDIYYMDDFQTSQDDISWNHFSRYLGTFILNDLATFGKDALDSSPLLQIMAVILVVASSLILIYLIRKKIDLIGVVASLPLGLSPHFLQNFSYKFESLFMCVALFFAIFPFLFKENRRVFIAVSIIFLMLMFMTYQATNGTYIILSLYFAFCLYFFEKRDFKESAIFLFICVANLIVASLIYKFVIAKPVSEVIVQYASDKVFALDNLLLGVWANLSAYLAIIFNDFRQTPYIWLLAFVFALFIANATIRTNRPKIATIFATILFLVLGICLSYGLYLVLENTIFEPRTFYGFNALIAVLCIANASSIKSDKFALDSSKIHKTLHYASTIILIITAYFLISFANIYGNALKKQDEYLDFRAKLLLKDLGDNVPQGAMVNLKIYLDYSAVTKRFIEKYGGISRLIPKTAENDWFFYLRLQHLNKYNIQEELCNYIQEHFNSEVVLKNAYHTIEKAKSCYVITLR